MFLKSPNQNIPIKTYYPIALKNHARRRSTITRKIYSEIIKVIFSTKMLEDVRYDSVMEDNRK